MAVLYVCLALVRGPSSPKWEHGVYVQTKVFLFMVPVIVRPSLSSSGLFRPYFTSVIISLEMTAVPKLPDPFWPVGLGWVHQFHIMCLYPSWWRVCRSSQGESILSKSHLTSLIIRVVGLSSINSCIRSPARQRLLRLFAFHAMCFSSFVQNASPSSLILGVVVVSIHCTCPSCGFHSSFQCVSSFFSASITCIHTLVASGVLFIYIDAFSLHSRINGVIIAFVSLSPLASFRISVHMWSAARSPCCLNKCSRTVLHAFTTFGVFPCVAVVWMVVVMACV